MTKIALSCAFRGQGVHPTIMPTFEYTTVKEMIDLVRSLLRPGQYIVDMYPQNDFYTFELSVPVRIKLRSPIL